MSNICLELQLALSRLEFLKPNEKIILEKNCSSLTDLLKLSIDDISFIVNRSIDTRIWPYVNLENYVRRDIFLMEKLKIGLVHLEDKNYPHLLSQIYDPPYVLFYRGNLECLQKDSVAIVGSRHASMESQKITLDFSQKLSEIGFSIVSGLAYGIDSCAHRGNLRANSRLSQSGKTVAVLAGGLDSVYPKANIKLASAILEKGGCLVSEYAPCEKSVQYHFPARNRIISGLCSSVIIMEAPPKSGSLITADFAIEQDRELFFHKNAVDYDLKLGNEFLKNKDTKTAKKMKQKRVAKYVEDGATVIQSVDEFLKALFNDNNITKNYASCQKDTLF